MPRRRERDYDPRADYADAPGGAPRRPPAPPLNVPGVIGMVVAIVALLVSLFPCVGWMVGAPMALAGLVLGAIGLATGRKTSGRGFSIAAVAVSVIALLAGGGWLLFSRYMVKRAQENLEAQQAQARVLEQQARADHEKAVQAQRELAVGKATAVTAAGLYKTYRANAADADRQYGGRILEVSGPIHRIEKDGFGRLTVELDPGENGLIRCEFPRGQEAELEGLKPEHRVTIRGRCAGAARDVVRLESCSVVGRDK
jgi:hypothetical protein